MPQVGVDALDVMRFALARRRRAPLGPRRHHVVVGFAASGAGAFRVGRGVQERLGFFSGAGVARAKRAGSA